MKVNTLASLQREIYQFMRSQPHSKEYGPLAMQDLAKRAVEAQERIEKLGYRWDPERELWRAPVPRLPNPVSRSSEEPA